MCPPRKPKRNIGGCSTITKRKEHEQRQINHGFISPQNQPGGEWKTIGGVWQFIPKLY